MFLATKLSKYYVIVHLLFLLSKARQAKRKFKVKKIGHPKWRKKQKQSYVPKFVMSWALVTGLPIFLPHLLSQKKQTFKKNFLKLWFMLFSHYQYNWPTFLWMVIGQKLCEFFVFIQHLCFHDWNHHIFYAILSFIWTVCFCHFYVWIFHRFRYAWNCCLCRDTW